MLIILIKSGLSAFLASLCYSFIFNVKGKNIWIAGLIGAIGGIFYKVSLYFTASELLANFIGVIALSLLSEILARKCKTPVTTFLGISLIPLVPGAGMYQTMLRAIHGNATQALKQGLSTISIAGVLAFGILIVSTCMRLYYYEKQKIQIKKKIQY